MITFITLLTSQKQTPRYTEAQKDRCVCLNFSTAFFHHLPLCKFKVFLIVNQTKWLRNHPWIFLFQNFIHCTALH